MNYRDILQLASSLVVWNSGNPESRFRCAVGRTYFATYNCAVHVLSVVGFEVLKNSNGHHQAYEELFNCNQKEARRAARILNDLRSDRNAADYHLDDEKFSESSTVKTVVESGQDAISFLEKCLEEPVRSNLVKHFNQRNG